MSGLDGYTPPPTDLRGVYFQVEELGLVIDGYLDWESVDELIEYLTMLKEKRYA